jgi:hypothetical protein
MALTSDFLLIACATGLLAAAGVAIAQTPTSGTARPDPLDPNAPVPALDVPSSLSSYRAWGETQPLSWQRANDDVSRIGGWRAYLRQAQAPDAEPQPVQPAAPPADATTQPAAPAIARPPAAGHSGHHRH